MEAPRSAPVIFQDFRRIFLSFRRTASNGPVNSFIIEFNLWIVRHSVANFSQTCFKLRLVLSIMVAVFTCHDLSSFAHCLSYREYGKSFSTLSQIVRPSVSYTNFQSYKSYTKSMFLFE